MFYNIVVFSWFMALFRYIETGHAFQKDIDFLRIFGVILPLMIIECLIYMFSVRPGYRRFVYQFINREK